MHVMKMNAVSWWPRHDPTTACCAPLQGVPPPDKIHFEADKFGNDCKVGVAASSNIMQRKRYCTSQIMQSCRHDPAAAVRPLAEVTFLETAQWRGAPWLRQEPSVQCAQRHDAAAKMFMDIFKTGHAGLADQIMDENVVLVSPEHLFGTEAPLWACFRMQRCAF